jgi:hypothetical protein
LLIIEKREERFYIDCTNRWVTKAAKRPTDAS